MKKKNLSKDVLLKKFIMNFMNKQC